MGKSYQNIHEDIIRRCIAGNAKAQYELYSLYSKAMFNVCMRILNSRENAEDALQDAFCDIFDKLDTFRFEASFGAWAKRIVVNTCLNKLKKKSPALQFTDGFPEIGQNSEDQVDFGELQLKVEQLRKAISLLPDGYRVILSLYLLEGYDHSEISTVLGISESTSKTQYMKAKKKVKSILEAQL